MMKDYPEEDEKRDLPVFLVMSIDQVECVFEVSRELELEVVMNRTPSAATFATAECYLVLFSKHLEHQNLLALSTSLG